MSNQTLCSSFELTIARETEPDWQDDIKADVWDECEKKFGKVLHVAVDPNSQGDVYIKFQNLASGERAIKGLNGRNFGGARIRAAPVSEAIYNSLWPNKTS